MHKGVKIGIIITCILLTISTVDFAVMATPWLILYVGLWMSPDPAKPQTTYAEFPFEIVYQIEGETVTVTDVFICEYDGIGINEAVGKYVEWKGYIKSSKKEEFVLLTDHNVKIICTLGDPKYYMDYPAYDYPMEQGVVPELILYEQSGDIISSHLLSEEEQARYKIQLIHWEFSAPISNVFE